MTFANLGRGINPVYRLSWYLVHGLGEDGQKASILFFQIKLLGNKLSSEVSWLRTCQSRSVSSDTPSPLTDDPQETKAADGNALARQRSHIHPPDCTLR